MKLGGMLDNVDVVIDIKSLSLTDFNNQCRFQRMYGTADPIRTFFQVPKKIRTMANDKRKWDCHKEDHIGEENPFDDDINKWYLDNWGAFGTCINLRNPEYNYTDGVLSNIILHYNTQGGDNLEAWMILSKKFCFKVSASCLCIAANKRVQYTIDKGFLIEHMTTEVTNDDRFDTDDEVLYSNNITVDIIRQEDYDRLHPGVNNIYFEINQQCLSQG